MGPSFPKYLVATLTIVQAFVPLHHVKPKTPNSKTFNPNLAQHALKGATHEISMPALSSTMTEGKIVQWLKEVGDEINSGDAVMVVESDKADMDVESFEGGYLASILVKEGETTKVGSTVGIIVENKEDINAVANGEGLTKNSPSETVQEAKPIESSSNKPTDIEFSEIAMPALSSTMTEGKIVQYLKSVGDRVNSGDAIMVVESDKADMEYEVFDEGYLAMIVVEEGSSANVGATCAVIVSNEADIEKIQKYSFDGLLTPATTLPPSPAAPTPTEPISFTDERVIASGRAKKLATELGIDLKTVQGSGPNGRVQSEDVMKVRNGGKSDAINKRSTWVPAAGVINATPKAKALAKSKKVDLSSIQGTGNFNRVTEDDVKRALGLLEKTDVKAVSVEATSVPSYRDVPDLPDGPKAMDGMQKAVAKNMEAGMDVPVFRVSRRIKTDAFDDLYRQLKPLGVTVSALLAKAAALALESHPIVNAAYAPGQIVYRKDINVSMAVAIDGGLITPVLPKANLLSLLDLSAKWKELVMKAKKKSLKAEEYNSGTFFISNLGMFGVSDFGALLPVGAGSILAIGGALPTVVQRPDGSFTTVKEMTVTITCDHRHIYGADAAEFLKTFADLLENNCARLML